MRQETRKRVVEVRCPVTVPREIGSLSRMNDDRTNIIVSQQRRDLIFGDWTSATIFAPRQVWTVPYHIGNGWGGGLVPFINHNRCRSVSPWHRSDPLSVIAGGSA